MRSQVMRRRSSIGETVSRGMSVQRYHVTEDIGEGVKESDTFVSFATPRNSRTSLLPYRAIPANMMMAPDSGPTPPRSLTPETIERVSTALSNYAADPRVNGEALRHALRAMAVE